MNPFVNPEFWLSLAFFIVIGMIIFSPVRHAINRFFESQQKNIKDEIEQANSVYSEALQGYKEADKNLKEKFIHSKTQEEIKALQQEFLKATQKQIEAKKQDFQVHKNLQIQEIKNNLRFQLLNEAENQIFKKNSTKMTDKEVNHLLDMLDKNKEILSQLLQ